MATKTSTHTADISILKNPRVTEKAAHASAHNTYLFDVSATATKSEIAKAFETVYKKKPVSVNTVSVRRKSVYRRGKLGFQAAGKKAYVTLAKGVTIDIA